MTILRTLPMNKDRAAKKGTETAKFRHEYKYLSSASGLTLLEHRLNGLVKLDSHVEESCYEIRSIYFDDIYKSCYKQNEAGTDPRAKYRIRAYDCSDEIIVLEKKIKQRGMTRKESVRLSKVQYQQIMAGEYQPMLRELSGKERSQGEELLIQFVTLALTRHMCPAVIVIYERTPYVEANGNVRITFDRNIASSVDFEHFFEKEIVKMPVLQTGEELLEVKYDAFLPRYIKEALTCGELSQTTFSKYYLCRQERLRR